jgi:hypothetical protein
MFFLRALIASLSLAAPALAQDFAAPKNAMDQPDLSGHWTNASSTTLERDPAFGDRLTMSEEEAAALPRGATPMKINGKVRTSFLVAPADGQLPDLTPQARGQYNNTTQITQSPDHVVIMSEMIHDARIIPLNAKHQPKELTPRGWAIPSAGGKATRWWSKTINAVRRSPSCRSNGSPSSRQPDARRPARVSTPTARAFQAA